MTDALMRSPRSVDIEITSRCNLRCTYCSHFSSGADVAEDLPSSEWIRFFDELAEAKVLRVVFSGGEPFVRDDFLSLITHLSQRPLRFAILTNGTLIDSKTAQFLAACRRLDYIQISLDGAESETHDAFRGKGSFEQVVSGIEFLKQAGITPVVRVTVHRQNYFRLKDIARFILGDLGLPSFSTNSASHMGLCRRNAAITQLTPPEYGEAMEILLELSELYPGRISATAGPLADGFTWWNMEQARRGCRPAPQGGGFLSGCNGPFQTLAVRADGAMIPCQQLGHLPLGQINRDSLTFVWQHHPTLFLIRHRHRIPLSSFSLCEDCPYVAFCTGNCSATAYTHFGEINHPSPEGCLKLFLENGGHLPDHWERLHG
ncbi:MAG TPA: SynChlorMet cassette radical SAM/SPASM protein ScmE [Syntrophales bacterium]|mgnify:CR=1 FL=1|nr:SynChlorMet cassette radical SAM/SPASM protein ScmE [Syntrophales bacterium]HOL58469.1 SynChlorMet cassette radical SAM/SPASM protein ScmE [Syntrophales bacterium]HPO34923.1 SynChlorMet cassette radical SAM/SPASM protein ScmE [Syntrophales bacterium]